MTKQRIKRNIFYFIQFCILLFGVSFPFWQSKEVLHIYSPLWVVAPGFIFMILFALAFGTVFHLKDRTAKHLKKIVSYWLAGGFILFWVLILFLGLNVFLGLDGAWVRGSALAVSSVIIAYAYHEGKKLRTIEILYQSTKVRKPYHFVHLSDIHIGSNGKEEVERIVRQLDTMVFDFVVITGDLVDEDFATMYDLQPLNTIKQPIYYITGNHEYYLRQKSFKDFLQKTNIQDINDQKVLFKELDIYGVDEKSDIGKVLDSLKIDNERYSVCLMHEPRARNVKKASERYVDLLLSGHTHNGQIYPFTLMVNLRYRFIKGVYKVGATNLYVNQGTGTWGPKMRLKSYNEVTRITIEPVSL